MKTLKSLTLFTALVILSACSASGNDSKNNGGSGSTGGSGGGSGGGSDAFLTAISKFSKMVGNFGNTPNGEITVSLDGKTLTETATGQAFEYIFIKSLSATKAEYEEDKRAGEDAGIATFEIVGDKVEMLSILFGTGGSKVILTPVAR